MFKTANRWWRIFASGMVIAVVTSFLSAGTAEAFECPKHISKAETMVEQLANLIKTMKGQMPSRDIRFLHGILDDARLFVVGAKHSHNEALGYHDHVRAIIRVHQVEGHVIAANLLHKAFMAKMK